MPARDGYALSIAEFRQVADQGNARMEDQGNKTERTILLVDDEENIIKALVRLFRREGYRIFKAGCGREGLELLKENEISVIVSDQRMPEMTGVEFLSRVKDLYPDTVRIALSGYTDLECVTDAINQGAIYKFLTKPWEDDLLRRNIREAFEHFELARENRQLTERLKETNAALSQLNQELEMRVEEKTLQILLRMHSLQMAQEILERLPAGIIGIDEDGIVVAANHAAHEVLHMQSGSLMGMPAQSILPPTLNACLESMASDPGIACQSLVLPGGTSVWSSISPLGATSHVRGKVLFMYPMAELR